MCAVDETRVDLAEKFEVGTKFINASFIDVSVSWACVFIALISFREVKFKVGTKFINASFIDVSVCWACVFIALISFRIFPSDTVTQYVLL